MLVGSMLCSRFPHTGEHMYSYLNAHLGSMAAARTSSVHLLASSLHVWPDFHGNRSPLADPNLRGMVKCGATQVDYSYDQQGLYLLFSSCVSY